MKSCSNCFQIKPDDQFYTRRQGGRLGRQSRCKACNAEVVRSYKRMKDDRDRQARWDAIYGRKKATA